MPPAFRFRVTHRDGHARCGELETAHGLVHTPAFMPVGTQGVVKALTHRQVEQLGAEIVLANTYHLYLRPGDDLIARRGGLHRFMGWHRPILTDSGGYQVFSLGAMRDRAKAERGAGGLPPEEGPERFARAGVPAVVEEEGVRFRSHLDGSEHLLTPEKATDIQLQLGSDIAMVLDECLAHPSDANVVSQSIARTLRWATRARERFLRVTDGVSAGDLLVTNPGQAQFGIVQGGMYPELRAQSAHETVALGFEAYAIGGLSVGEPLDVMYDVVGFTAPLLPDDRLRYLMGTGMPDDLIECVARGIDLFDCVLPTRNARNGQLLTRQGPLAIKNARYAEDDRPADEECECYTCRHFSRAYLRHLYLAHEMTAATLNTLHNLHFYLDTMRSVREAIVFGRLENFRQEFRKAFSRRPLTS